MTLGHPLPMNALQMLALARQETGLDISDLAAVEPLTVLVESYNSSAGFSAIGAQAKHQFLLRILKNRLRMQRDFAAHPEIAKVNLEPPLVINALARTGSTKLQKLLSATGDFNALPAWMVINPSSWTGIPHEDTSARIAEIESFIGWLHTKSPASERAHAMHVHAPEETSSILMHSLVSPTMTGYANAPEYIAWYLQQDHGLQFHYLSDALKYLTWQGLADPAKPFVLKSAMSVGYEDALLAAFPNARLIMTHRDPSESLPSTFKLIQALNAAFSDNEIDHALTLPSVRFLISRHLDFRERMRHLNFFDVSYPDLQNSALSVVRAIYEYCGLAFSQTAVDAIATWEVQNPEHRHGHFGYSLAEFGMTEELVDDVFARYIGVTNSLGLNVRRLGGH